MISVSLESAQFDDKVVRDNLKNEKAKSAFTSIFMSSFPEVQKQGST